MSEAHPPEPLNGVAVSGPDTRPEPVDPEDIKRDIERTREELSNTVEALAHKVNVPAQVKEKAHETGVAVQAKAAEVQLKAGVAADKAVAKLPPGAQAPAQRAVHTVLAKPVPVLLGALGSLIALRLLLRRKHS
jgi:hypothetical protein